MADILLVEVELLIGPSAKNVFVLVLASAGRISATPGGPSSRRPIQEPHSTGELIREAPIGTEKVVMAALKQGIVGRLRDVLGDVVFREEIVRE